MALLGGASDQLLRCADFLDYDRGPPRSRLPSLHLLPIGPTPTCAGIQHGNEPQGFHTPGAAENGAQVMNLSRLGVRAKL